MLQVQGLNYTIGDRVLMANINWIINPGARIALIGPNGTGKTTLLRILAGESESASGNIVKPKDYVIGYLPQEETVAGKGPILQVVLDGQKEIASLTERIESLHQSLGDNPGDENLLNQLGSLEERFGALGGYQVEYRAKTILSGLGFKESDFSRPMVEFSGGWRMRVNLALLLLQEPDLLLLDEPTNHLDIPSLEWLEQYLLGFSGSIVLVSHDRFFIDRLAQGIVELEMGQLTHYSGNYHTYEDQKEKRRQLLEKKWQEQQEERARQERFINRFRYKNTKTTQVQSRIKQLEKMEKIEIPPPPPRLDFTISTAVKSYKDVLTVRELDFRYEEEAPLVLQGIDINMYRGEKVALIGVNGAGKTTFTRLIAGQLQPTQGSLELGERVVYGYYAQHQIEALNLEATVYEEVSSTVAVENSGKIRDVLGVFQFSGDDVNKKIGVLSGGEKARVSLAKILLSPVNFLVMDEPTTHLDKNAKEALERSLFGYDGTLLVISHDRYFLDKLVSRVLELKGGSLEEFHGNYSYYLQKRRVREQEESAQVKEAPEKAEVTQGGKKTKEQKRLEAQARQAVSKDINKVKKEITRQESLIDQLEERIKEIEETMSLPGTYDDKGLTVKLQKEYADKKKELEIANLRWEEAQVKLEEIEAVLPGKSP